MSCTSDPPSCSVRGRGTRAAQRRARGRAGLTFVVLLGAACTGSIGPLGQGPTPTPTQAGGGGATGSSQGGGASGSGQGGGTLGTGGTTPVVLSKGGVMLRLLTQAEYLASVRSLLGTLTTQLTPPEDNSVA